MIGSTPEGFATTREAAVTIGVTNKTVERWADGGKIEGAERQTFPSSPSGFRWLVPTKWVQAEKRRRARAARRKDGGR